MFASLIDFSTLQAILANPIVLAAIIAVLRNLGGYAYNCFEAKKILPYSASQFLVTLGLWETVFVSAMGVASIDTQTTTLLGFFVDIVRGLKTAITNITKTAITS